MRAVIVDDEMAARGLLRKRLRDFPEIEIIAEAENELVAIELINKNKPDLVFLDIQMTMLSGFEVLLYLEERPLIVFCTAHDHYAVKAFEENAIDYLLKPVSKERLAKCLEKVKKELNRESTDISDVMEGSLARIVGDIGNRKVVLRLDEILLFRKEGRYTTCWSRDQREVLTSLTIDYLEDHIPEQHFFRIDRGTIIHRDLIQNFRPNAGIIEITSTNDSILVVSRRRCREFKTWIAT